MKNKTNVSLTPEAESALYRLPRWVVKAQFLATVLKSDIRCYPSVAAGLTYTQNKTLERSAQVIAAVEKVRAMEL